jgi:pimeloyl-ACP methyl ester carboxylesterase
MITTDLDPPAILLVHGFWHGSWCWADVAARLAGAGRRVLAVDLAGHGLRARRPVSAGARPFDAGAFAAEVSPIASVDLEVVGALLVAQIEAFAGGEPVCVAVHSAGGPILTRAAQIVPHLIRHAVYVAAFMPATDRSAVSYLREPEQDGDLLAPLFVGDPTATGAVRLDVGDPGDYRKALRGAFYADVAEDEADTAIALLTPDAPAAVFAGTTALTQDGWGSVRRTHVHCSRDYAIRPALQRRFVREADTAYPGNPTTVVELDSSHSPFLSQPGLLADVIAGAR